jgi:ATP-binding cassette, subfamily B, bacterial PglK
LYLAEATLGQKRVAANQSRYKAVMEGFGAFKEVKAFERGEHFVRAYENPTRRFNRYLVACSLIKQMPRYFLETLAFGGLVALVLYFLAAGGDIRNMVPLLVLYAFAAYRLMPAVQVCFGCLTTLRFHHHLVGRLYQDFHDAGQASHDQGESLNGWRREKLSLEKGIRFENVSFAYPGARLTALREVSLTIPCRSMVAFCGATGSGKTTMVDLLLGLLPPSGGEIRVDGLPLTQENLPRWRRCVGYVPQEIFLSDDTLLRNIAFGVPDDEIDATAVERAAKAARIHDFIIKDLPEGYQTEVGERGIRLSGGQRQRLGIARALYHDPEVLIFDEATSALDGRTEKEVMAAIQNAAKAKTVIMIAHRLTTVEACDRIFVVEEGRVVEQGAFGHLVDLNGTFRSLARSGRAIPAKEAS